MRILWSVFRLFSSAWVEASIVKVHRYKENVGGIVDIQPRLVDVDFQLRSDEGSLMLVKEAFRLEALDDFLRSISVMNIEVNYCHLFNLLSVESL